MSYSKESSRAFWAARSKASPYNTKAHRKWGKEAAWIHSEGPYASLAYCPSSGSHGQSCLTIQLYSTLQDALRAQFNLHCGGHCKDTPANSTSYHQIWELSNRGYRRVNKQAEYQKTGIENIEPLSAVERLEGVQVQTEGRDGTRQTITIGKNLTAAKAVQS